MKFAFVFVKIAFVISCLFFLNSCWYAAAAGAGAYGGYKAKEAGYTLQSPVKKESADKKSEKNKKDTGSTRVTNP